MIRKILSGLLLCALPFAHQAQQKLSIDNIRSVSLRNFGTIVESEEVKGYFVYYISDKVDKNTNEYTIQIIDENLAPIKNIVFQSDKDDQLMETSFNQNSLMFMFFNKKMKTFTSKVYGLDGKLKYTYLKEINKRSLAYLSALPAMKMNEEEGQNKFLYDVADKGYVSVIPLRSGRDYSFEVNIFRSDTKKQITYVQEDEGYKFYQASYLGATSNIALFEVMKKEKMMSNKMESSLLGIDLSNGRKVFDIRDDLTKYKFLPINISTLTGTNNILILGTYYDKDAKLAKDATLGIAAVTIDPKGKIVSQKYNSWSSDFAKHLPVSSKGKIDDIGYLYFHKIIQTESGEIFAVGEGYKRVASAGGIAGTVALAAMGGYSSSVSTTRLDITDMVLVKFNKEFDILEAKVYDKNKNRFSLPGGDFVSPHLLALGAKTMGAYDYEFTRTDKDHTHFVVGYNDYEKGKDYKGTVFHSISYNGGKLTTDKINLKSSASSLRVMPGKPGFIFISEYFKKDKKVDMRLEKIN